MAKIYNMRRDPAEEPVGTPVRDVYDLVMPALRRQERLAHCVGVLLVVGPLFLLVVLIWAAW